MSGLKHKRRMKRGDSKCGVSRVPSQCFRLFWTEETSSSLSNVMKTNQVGSWSQLCCFQNKNGINSWNKIMQLLLPQTPHHLLPCVWIWIFKTVIWIPYPWTIAANTPLLSIYPWKTGREYTTHEDSHQGKRILHQLLKQKIQDLWRINENFPLIYLGNDYFTVKLQKEESMNQILEKGPYFIYGNFLSVQRWQPNFVAMEAVQNFTAVWIRLP